jgi:hypothetical protein
MQEKTTSDKVVFLVPLLLMQIYKQFSTVAVIEVVPAEESTRWLHVLHFLEGWDYVN